MASTTLASEAGAALEAQAEPESAGAPQMADAPLVSVRDAGKEYSLEGRRVHALRAVHLEVVRGRFLAVIGRSGCGKSTLLNLLGGLDRPTRGEVFVAGLPVHALQEKQLTHYRRFTVGIVFQFFNLLPLLTVAENTALPALLAGRARRASHEKARALLERVGLGARLDQPASLLSGGEMQRVAVARALINDPALVLADEPTGNLDSASAGVVLETLRRLSAETGATVVMVTHSPEAAAIADEVREMRDGQFVN
jgi:putative ABC transport system ATP-binding protein